MMEYFVYELNVCHKRENFSKNCYIKIIIGYCCYNTTMIRLIHRILKPIKQLEEGDLNDYIYCLYTFINCWLLHLW